MRFVFNVYTIYKFKAAGVEENCLGYTGENLAIIFSSCCAIPEFGENAPICAEREHREHIAHSDPIQLQIAEATQKGMGKQTERVPKRRYARATRHTY